MARIVATLATFPPRAGHVEAVVARIIGQVDVLHVVLNEYAALPDWAGRHPRANLVIPDEDTKDTGKFLPTVAPDDWLFTIDDDIAYPADYVERSLRAMEAPGLAGAVGGYHGTIYRRPGLLVRSRLLRRALGRSPDWIVTSRTNLRYWEGLNRAVVVEQLGTGAAFMRGRDAPPFAAVRTAQRFIDVRLARWCHEMGRRMVCLPRPTGWLRPAEGADEEASIFQSFTRRSPSHVAEEIRTFAFRVPGAGAPP